MKLSIIIPTYNEKKNIGILIPTIEKEFSKKYKGSFEVIVVDDDSPDGTGECALSLNKKYGNVRLISRNKKGGIGSALKEGYDNALGDLIISTDADLSFDVKDMPRLISKTEEGYDLVVGSRHLSRSDYEKPNFKSKIKGFISRYGNILVRKISGVDINDFSANFRIIRKEVWRRLNLKDNTNSVLMEMILKTKYKGYKVAEMRVKFIDRIYGESKLNLAKEMPKFFLKLIYHTVRCRILGAD